MGCDETTLKAAELKEEVWKEVLIYHPDPPAEEYEEAHDSATYHTLDATNPFNDSAYLLDGEPCLQCIGCQLHEWHVLA